MKKNYKQCKTRFLLFFLLSLFAGGLSPAWADAYTCGFEASEGWSTEKVGYYYYTTVGTDWNLIAGEETKLKNHELWTTKKSGTYSLKCDYENATYYAITPYLAAGNISFYARYTQSTYNLKIYKASFNGETFEVEGLITSWNKSGTKLTNSFTQYSFELDEDSYVAILLDRVAMDDFSAPNGTTTPSGIAKPRSFAVSNVTANSADFTWSAGGEETEWDFSYSTTSGNPDNGTIVSVNSTSYSLTGLTAETTYYASVRAKVGEEYSDWCKEISFTPSRAVQLTVNDGTTTNSYVPIYGNYVDYYDKVEFIIPSASLADMANSDIKALTFYLSSPAAASWGNANFKIYMTEVENTTVSSYTFNDNDYTALYSGSLDGTKSEMAITLTTPYSYSGGNLLVGVYNTAKGSYKSASFYGVSAENGASAYGTNSSSLASITSVSKQSFLPKTTFTYLPVDGAVMKVSETAFDFGTITAESTVEEKTKTFTISNKGNATLENISVAYTGDDVFTLSDGIATSIAEGGDDITVTVTMNTSTPGDYSGTITVSATDQTPVEISVVGTYAANPATIAISLGEEAVGETVAFGNVGKSITKTFTVTNDGNLKLNISSITSSNVAFTVSPATLEVAGKSSETFTVTFVYDASSLDIEKTANITVTPSNEGIAPVTFAVTATSVEMWSEDFSGNKLPGGWTADANYWTFADGVAKSKYNDYHRNNYLCTPTLVVSDASETLTFSYTTTGTYVNIPVYYSKDGGDYTAYSGTPTSLNNNVSGTFTITGLEAGNYKFRFGNDSYNLDNFEGFKLNNDDPKFGIYTDAECKVAASTSVTKDFGFVTEAPEATVYYLKNDNTGTLTLTLSDIPTGFTAALGKVSLAAGESTTLTMNMSVETKGYTSGNIVVTAKNSSDSEIGTFTFAASGVSVDENKLYLNFATDNIPASWTNSNFTKNANGYIESPYGGGTLQTSTLTAEAGETIIIVAKQGYSSTSYTTAVNYRKVGDEEWSTLIAAQNLYNSANWQMITATIAEAGDYELQFVGRYVHIQRIYGLAEPQIPFMAVYDGTTAAAATYNFGNVANDADATHTFTIKNEGNGTLVGVAATLSGDQASHYSVEISGLTEGNIAGKSEATLIVTQKKDNLGAHAATLTISSTDESIADIVIELSGVTRDASKMYVDFDTPNAFPEGWTAGTSWNVYTYGTDRYAYQSNNSTASALVTTPLTVDEGETLTFQAARYSSYSAADLKARYTMDGGVTWSEYVDYASQITSGSFVTLELTDVPAGTAVVEFYGRYVKLDNISGFAPTTAPMFALATSETLTDGKYDFGQSLQEAPADKVFTITNSGNGNLVSTIAATGDVTAVLATTDGELSNEDKTVTLEPGETATITVSLIFDASEIGEQNGSVTIDSNEPVADVVLNFTANVIDPTAFNIDFANNTKPEGWYVSPNGYIFTGGVAKNSMSSIKDLITQKLRVAGEEDVLSYDAYVTASWAESYASLVVSYSTDRKNWTEVSEQPTLATTSNTFQIKGLAAGDYYLKFAGEYVAIDNISGWHIVTGIDHDLYVSDATFPTTTLIPETEDGVSASVTVNSLRADESGVYAKLFFDETEIATAAQDIAKDGNKTFNLIGNVPANEKTYAAKIVVYYSDETVAWETATTEVEVAHTKTLDIKEFTRTDEGGDLTADENNQFSAAFSVKVQNTGTTEATPTVKIFIGETEVGSATATETVAVEGETTIAVNVTNASAGEGGELEFTAKAYWTAEGEALATSANNVTINVAAAAPKFALYEGEIAVENNTAVNFGLQTAAKTISYTIKNEGNKAMELVSIVAPEGFEATALTEGNKTIAVDGALNIDVTLKAEQGKVAGDLVITYKVDAMTDNTFTLALSGRSIAADTWTVAFNDYTATIPSDWTNKGWSIAGEYNANPGAIYTYTATATVMTPRLAAAEGEELTFDVVANYYDSATYAYSTDKLTWSDEVAISGTGEMTFTAPAAGNYYLRFTGRGAYINNFVGFRLNPLDLILDETASNSFDTANYDNVTLNRAFIAGWNTVCLPFAIDNITAFFGDGAYAYTYTGYNEGDLTFTIVEDAMTAATPYLVFVPAAINSKELKNIAISGEDAGSVGDENATFTGTYDRIVAGKLADKYVLTPNATIQKAGDGAWMNAFRAYFTIPTGLVKALVFDGGTATGVRRIELTGNEDVRDIFDLAGRKLNETRKGINIVNGKKVLVK